MLYSPIDLNRAMQELEVRMSSGVPHYERDLLDVLRQGRGVPPVPLVLVGVNP